MSYEIFLLAMIPPSFLYLMSIYENQNVISSPIRVLSYTFFFGYSLKTIYLSWAVESDGLHRLSFLGTDSIYLGTFATMLSMVFLIAGYLVPTSNFTIRAPKISISYGPSMLLYNIFLYGSIMLMAIFFFEKDLHNQIRHLKFIIIKYAAIEGSEVGTSHGFLTIGSDFFIIFMSMFMIYSKKIRFLNIYFISILFIVLCFVMVGRRNAVFIYMIFFVLVFKYRFYLYPKKSFKINDFKLFTFKNVIVVAILFSIISFSSAVRKTGQENRIEDISVSQALHTVSENMFHGAYFMDPSKTGGIIQETVRKDLFLYGGSYTPIIFAPIPRVWWPEKPIIRNSYFVAEEVLGVFSNSGIPPGAIGELYLNFGWIGIIIGMFFTGMVLKHYFSLLLHNPNNKECAFNYIVIQVTMILFIAGDGLMALIFFIKYSIAVYIARNYWRHRSL